MVVVWLNGKPGPLVRALRPTLRLLKAENPGAPADVLVDLEDPRDRPGFAASCGSIPPIDPSEGRASPSLEVRARVWTVGA